MNRRGLLWALSLLFLCDLAMPLSPGAFQFEFIVLLDQLSEQANGFVCASEIGQSGRQPLHDRRSIPPSTGIAVEQGEDIIDPPMVNQADQ